MANNKLTVSISLDSIFRVILVLVVIGFLWIIRDIVALVFVSLVLASALDPTVDFFQQWRIPRVLGTAVIYIIILFVVGSVVVAIAGPIASEVRNIASDIPTYYRDIDSNINLFFRNSPTFFTVDKVQSLRGGLNTLIANLTRIASEGALPLVSTLFGGIVSFVLTLVVTFYFIVQENAVKQFISWVVPPKNKEETLVIIEKIQKKLGLWLRGQLLLSLIIFFITYVGLSVLGVKYALVLALLAGLFEVIPYLGPIMSAIPAIFLTLVAPTWGGPFKALLVLILYIIIQQAENNFLVPKVMSRAVGLNPLIVILSMLIGAQLAGIVGLIIAIPVATGITVYLQERGFIKTP